MIFARISAQGAVEANPSPEGIVLKLRVIVPRETKVTPPSQLPSILIVADPVPVVTWPLAWKTLFGEIGAIAGYG